MAFRLRFTEEQLRQLRSTQRPKLDKQGQPVLTRGGFATLEPSPDGQAWRFLDGSQGAPTGFGVYVGKTKATYEVQRKLNGKVMRFKVGSTRDMTLQRAHDLARTKGAQAEESNVHPTVLEKGNEEEAKVLATTVNDAICAYRDMLARRTNPPVSEGTMKMLRSSIMRLSRKGVELGDRRILEITEDDVLRAFDASRLASALNSNRLTQPVKDYMRKVGRVNLTDEELMTLGVDSDAKRVRVRAAGVSATEQTFATANRAVNYVLSKESRAAKKLGRNPLLRGNDFQVLWEEGKMRDAKALQQHYKDARVRNPLGQADGTLGAAIEYLWSRRRAQKGQNESGVYYLLTTLFLGARRNETARLAWFDRVPEHLRATTSWVWLDEMDPVAMREGRPSINPRTGKSGPQAFFAKTKNRLDHNMPLGPFGLALVRHRFERRLPASDPRAKWVYPARSPKAKEGHYKDSKAILKGLASELPVEFGPTPHDLRRTLGRYSGKLDLPDRITSRLFNHLPPREEEDDQDKGSQSSRRYQEPEWYELERALSQIQQLMASSAPTFYNETKPVDWPLLPVPQAG